MAGSAMLEVKARWLPLGRRRATALLRRVVPAVRKAVEGARSPYVTEIAGRTRSPLRVLVSTVISARTRDAVTDAASERLFARASTAREIAALSERSIAALIYPAGFYRTKARSIRGLSRAIAFDLGGRVPDTMEGLLALPGVGRKTANLVLTLGFGKPGICVDTHVHRISNRLGVVRTARPVETEAALGAALPREHWIEINDLFVMFGQTVCVPVSPRCSACPLARSCPRVGVKRSR